MLKIMSSVVLVKPEYKKFCDIHKDLHIQRAVFLMLVVSQAGNCWSSGKIQIKKRLVRWSDSLQTSVPRASGFHRVKV